MFDPPITTTGTITGTPKPGVYHVALPNGKTIIGHVPKSCRGLHPSLAPDVRVTLELTPYDLEKGRIVALADDSC